MSEAIRAYPLQWPIGWRRTAAAERTRARFSRREAVWRPQTENGVTRNVHAYDRKAEVTVAQGIERILDELTRMGVADRDDIVISTNMPTRLDGLPRSGAHEPDDPGVAVYWREIGRREPRCMAVDRYDRVADNLAAIAATLDAMRAIERHGGATILDRAFQGFTALPAPEQWFTTLGVSATATRAQIEAAYRPLAMKHHPDRPGGDAKQMARINAARDEGLQRASA